MFGEDNNGVWRETAVTTGGDMVIRHGRLWASDTPLLPDSDTDNFLFPVEFLNQSNPVEETELTTDSSPGSSTSDNSVATSDLATDNLTTTSSGSGSFSLIYILGMWGLIIMHRNQRASRRKVTQSPGR